MSATTKVEWPVVSAAGPCPVCHRGDRCKIAPNGDRVMCFREPSPEPAKGSGPPWYHPHPNTPPHEREPRVKFTANGKANPKANGVDWNRRAEGFQANLAGQPAKRQELADALRLPVEALDAMPGIGWNGTTPAFWSLPETDAAGAVVGINRRFEDPALKKRHIDGGRRGLTLPLGWSNWPGPVYVCEGASDALALTCAGLPCVGRFNNAGGADMLAALFAASPAEREIVILGENDEKPDGQFPGRDGARSVAAKLRAALPGRPIRMMMPPEGVKDARAFLTDPARDAMPWEERGAAFAAALVPDVPTPPPGRPEPAGPRAGGSDGENKKGKSPPAAEVLAAIAAEAELFHDPAGVAYATVGPRTFPVRSKGFRLHLVGEFHDRTGKVPGGEAIASALNTAESTAVRRGAEHPVFVRVAGHGGAVYFHLGDDDTTVYEIDANGWRLCDCPPVRFLRPSGMMAVPAPERGGDFSDLRRFVNCPDAAGLALLKGWVSAALNPGGPFLALGVCGEQGSAKTFTTKVVKSLLDPASAPPRSAPREERDLLIAARGAWVLAYDNLSGLQDWQSDAFCRLSTGGGFATRTLYENDEETVFEAKRPLILNGIDDPASRSDLLERMVILRHPAIPEGARRLESELWAEFEAARPRLLGALFDRVSAGLQARPRVDKTKLPRMADACAFAVACELGMGEKAEFLDAFKAGQRDGHDLALADSPVAGPLLAFMEDRDGWCGPPTDLFQAVAATVPDPKPKDWPRGANAFTNKLRRVVPDLRRVHGLDVADGRGNEGNRTRYIRISKRRERSRETPSGPSGAAGADPGPPAEDRPETGGYRPGPSGPEPTNRSVPDGPDGPDGVSLPRGVKEEGGPEATGPARSGPRRFRNDPRPEVSR